LIPFFLRKRIDFSFDSDRFKIQTLLFIIILYISVFDFFVNRELYSTVRTIAPFVLAFFFSFVRADYKFLGQFRTSLYVVFFIDFFVNLISIFFNLNINGISVNYFDSYYHSLSGVFGHPYLSVTLSAVTFLYATLFKDKRMKVISVSALFIGSSLRSLLIIYPLIIVYFSLVKRIRVQFIFFALILGVSAIFLYVKHDSNLEEHKRCDLNVHTNKYYNCKDLNSSALRYFAWTYFFKSEILASSEKSYYIDRVENYSHLTPKIIKEKKIFESPYLQASHDYGAPLFFLYITLFSLWFFQNYRNYFKIVRSSFSKDIYASKIAITAIFIFDSFYGVFFFCVISSLTLFFILFYEPKNATS
jgi:hypothetical protein